MIDLNAIDHSAPRAAAMARRALAADASRASVMWRIPIAAGIALAALATWTSAHKSLWIDEGYTELTTRQPFTGALDRALHYELQPPLYFGLLDLWRRLNASVLFARGFSTLCSVLFVITMAGVARRSGVRHWPWVAVGSALIPEVVWAATEMRGYALVLLLVALTLYFYLALVSLTPHGTTGAAIGYVLASSALLYTFYYGGFVLLGEWVGALVLGRRVALITGLLAITGCVLLPLLPTVAMQVSTHPEYLPSLGVTTQPVYATWKTVETLAQGYFTVDARLLALPHAVALLIALAIAIPVARSVWPRVPWTRTELGLTVVAAVPVLILGAMRIADITPVEPRHALITLPGVVLLYSVWLGRIGGRALRAAGVATVAAVLLAGVVAFERYGVQREDWRDAAQYVAQHAEPGDVVLIFDPDRKLPFGYYFARLAPHTPVFGVPIDMNLKKYDPMAYRITDTAAVAARVRSVAPGARSVWFVTTQQLIQALVGSPPFIRTYLAAHYRLDPAIDFPGVEILHGRGS